MDVKHCRLFPFEFRGHLKNHSTTAVFTGSRCAGRSKGAVQPQAVLQPALICRKSAQLSPELQLCGGWGCVSTELHQRSFSLSNAHISEVRPQGIKGHFTAYQMALKRCPALAFSNIYSIFSTTCQMYIFCLLLLYSIF